MPKVNEEQNLGVPSDQLSKDNSLKAEPSFTPGPWAVEGEGGYSIYAGDDPVVWEMGGIDREANARLIAAAPELYEAVKLALVYTRGQLEHAVVNYPSKPQTTLGEVLRNALALVNGQVTSEQKGFEPNANSSS